MKEVLAMIRPEGWAATKEALSRLAFPPFTHRRVLGRGATRGLRFMPRKDASPDAGVAFLPKRLIAWVVEDRLAPALIEALIEANRTGRMGDGRIFVLPVEDALRLRTGQRGAAALRPEPLAGAVRGGAPDPSTGLRAGGEPGGGADAAGR